MFGRAAASRLLRSSDEDCRGRVKTRPRLAGHALFSTNYFTLWDSAPVSAARADESRRAERLKTTVMTARSHAARGNVPITSSDRFRMEWMAQDDGFLALRPRGDNVDGRAGDFLDALQVGLGIGGTGGSLSGR